MSIIQFLAKVGATTTTIFITTADDALWLIPFITSPSLSTTNKMINAITFICTVQIIVLIAVALVYIFGSLVIEKTLQVNEEKYINVIAASITWMIVFYFYCKAKCKKIKRLREERLLDGGFNNDYQSLDGGGDSSSSDSVEYEEFNIGNDSSRSRPLTVFSLAFLGGIDELTYFPSLLIGKTFTPIELSLGAMIACILIIVIIHTVLSTCRPLLDWMDSIPLYYIIGILAIFLTVDAFLDFS